MACDDEAGFTLTVKAFGFSAKTEEETTAGAIARITGMIEKELNAKGVKCDGACGDGGTCYVDIEPPVDAQLTAPKPLLRYNPKTKKFETAWVCRMKKDTKFTISCQCAFE
ncbi:MAG: hypothetical protein ABSD03_10195 [Vulcanimicrobiaceae bacterium]|jgi:ferredoxin